MITINTAAVEAFWHRYVDSLPAGAVVPAEQPEAWHFCVEPADADELARLVRAGIKTATCSLLWTYEHTGERIPQVGDWSIIVDGAGEPVCIIETTEIAIRPYNAVDAPFAYDEGEGDRSLAYWREVHWRFFEQECREAGRERADDMPLVCERFRLIAVPSV